LSFIFSKKYNEQTNLSTKKVLLDYENDYSIQKINLKKMDDRIKLLEVVRVELQEEIVLASNLYNISI
jgi:hypothetical protein